MTITQAVAATYLRSTGKTQTLTTGNKYDRIVALLNYFQTEWSRENGVDWNSLYNPAFSLGTVTATDAFDLDTSSIRKLSDREGDTVRIVWSDGEGYSDYDIVPHDTLKDYYYGPNKESYNGKVCTVIAGQLVFNHTFTSSDAEFGGEIFVPCYTFADEITADNPDTDEVQVDNPNWLVVRTAAEYIRNDITRRQRYPELLTEANSVMEQMKDDQAGQIVEADRPWTPLSGIGNESAWG